MRNYLLKIKNSISQIGITFSDTQEEKLRKKAFSLISILKLIACFPWALLYFIGGLTLAAYFPLFFALSIFLNLLLFSYTKNFSIFVEISLFFMLIIPAILQWSLGGFFESGWVMIWSFLATIGALVFRGSKEASFWFLGFLLLVIVSVILEPYLPKQTANKVWIRDLFLIMNIGVVSTIVYITIVYFVNRANKEAQKSDDLLSKILPQKVVTELKEKGETMPLFYKSASVIFTDFVGFTKQAEKMKPTELVYELDSCFTLFDQIAHKYKVEKLKTIGDSYMGATGLPERVKTHPIDACLFGLEIQAIMKSQQMEKEAKELPIWSLRLGIHTGSVVAGVIGKSKIAYDIWGDTVNTASRMESSGMEGKVNISNTTYEFVKDFFEFEYRGKINAKNKGEIDMYFINGIKKNLSENGEGKIPNDEFYKMYNEILNQRK